MGGNSHYVVYYIGCIRREQEGILQFGGFPLDGRRDILRRYGQNRPSLISEGGGGVKKRFNRTPTPTYPPLGGPRG